MAWCRPVFCIRCLYTKSTQHMEASQRPSNRKLWMLIIFVGLSNCFSKWYICQWNCVFYLLQDTMPNAFDWVDFQGTKFCEIWKCHPLNGVVSVPHAHIKCTLIMWMENEFTLNFALVFQNLYMTNSYQWYGIHQLCLLTAVRSMMLKLVGVISWGLFLKQLKLYSVEECNMNDINLVYAYMGDVWKSSWLLQSCLVDVMIW